MSFFAEPDGEYIEVEEPGLRFIGAPPQDLAARVVQPWLVMARSESGAVVLNRIAVYPTGLDFALTLIWTRRRRWETQDARNRLGHHPGVPTVNFGVEFSDGRRITGGPGEASIGVKALISGGGDGRFEQSFWLWPLPPVGPVTFVIAVGALDIDETRLTIDAGVFHRAAEECEILWPEESRRISAPFDPADTAQDRFAGYGPAAIPDRRDSELDEYLVGLLSGGPTAVARAVALVSPAGRRALTTYAERAASRAVRDGRAGLLMPALVAVVVGGLDQNAPDALQRMAPIEDAGRRLNAELGEFFGDAADAVGHPGSVNLMLWLTRKREDRTLESMGYTVGEDGSGFRYIHAGRDRLS